MIGRDSPFDDIFDRLGAGRHGMWLFLASLAALFAAGLLGFLVVRLQLGERGLWPGDLPGLPRLLWLSTAVLLASSGTMQWAVACGRERDVRSLRLAMALTFALGLAFLALQSVCWWAWIDVMTARWSDSDAYRLALTGFYVLTGLHAAHVIGGVIPMGVITWRLIVRGDERAGDRRPFAGVQYTAIYWHFLDGVWLVLYLTLLVGL